MKTCKHTLTLFATACVFGLSAAGAAVAQPVDSATEACQLAVGGNGSGNKVGGNGSGNKVGGNGSGNKVGGNGSGNKVGGNGSGNKVGGNGSGEPDSLCQTGFWGLFR